MFQSNWYCDTLEAEPIASNLIFTFLSITVILVTAGSNQGLIMNKGGARLLANVASKTDDPQTLRMVAGAIANLCGNGTASCLYCYPVCFQQHSVYLKFSFEPGISFFLHKH